MKLKLSLLCGVFFIFFQVPNTTYTLISTASGSQRSMESSVAAVEEILRYKFNNWKLLEEALTHPSVIGSPTTYQRMEFLGDAALGLAVTNHIFLVYPRLPPGELSLLRSANVSTEKLARVAVRHGLYFHMRHNSPSLDIKIREFANSIKTEGDKAVYGRSVRAPKVLADIVESVAAAVYIDVGFDLEQLWIIFRGLLEPIITLKDLQDEPQPVTLLFKLCHKEGKQIDIKHWRDGDTSIAGVYIDGNFITSASSEHKEIAKMNAAKAALARFRGLESATTAEAMELCELETGWGINRLLSNQREGQNRKPEWIQDVEKIINYTFTDWSLLEQALTHPSQINSNSYQRLEFIGDAALGLAFTNHIYLVYPTFDEGHLSLLRAANTSTEKFGRVAVRHGLYRYLRCNSDPLLKDKVKEFVEAVEEEGETNVYGGSVKSPKVLADIVESVAAAIFLDVNFDLEKLWQKMRGMLEPIVGLEDVQSQPQPVTMLFEMCQKLGKVVNFEFGYCKEFMINAANVFVDGKLVASGCSKRKDIAKFNAAKAALTNLEGALQKPPAFSESAMVVLEWLNGPFEIQGAKQKLQELCDMKKWPRPSYRTEEERGPPHERKYVCSVQLVKPLLNDSLCMIIGDEKPRIKDAHNSAASRMIRVLYSQSLL